MAEQGIVVRKRRFFERKILWILGGVGMLLVIGVVLQMRMTWSRERLRDVSDDAKDAWRAAGTGIASIKPSSNPFQPLLDLLTSSDENSQ